MRRAAAAACLLAWIIFSLGCSPAFAQATTKLLRIVVPFPPGGTSDYLSRLIAERLTPVWGANVIVENRPGASNIIGSDSVARAAPDGHSLLMAFSTHASNLCVYKKLPYDTIRDFEPVTNVAIAPHVLVAHPSLPVRSVGDLIAIAKTKPGELNFASAGSGSSQHLAGEIFNSMTGVKLVHIPYKGGVPALNDVLGGHTLLMFAPILPVLPHINAGKLRPLGITSLRRSQILPDIPTLAESGLPGYESNSWFGLLTTGSTPKAMIIKLNSEIVRILKTPEVQKALLAQGVEPIGDSPEQFAEFIRAEIRKTCALVRALGISAD